ncbi:hypothetical protein OCH239_09305 [Roseivivax halodurans JCM 10272]|uniref:Uncharacterized protein n=1 Tax=Roseivivax halodurans JCM 10272 TaxID=1449350 RepID=X7ECH8_9RHOB|nr:hypothetical protein [Roseivivax halodurans]ETX13652.1 hypothetical protein OCH239_09305 [Roseivivax halodurans JCM 10272]
MIQPFRLHLPKNASQRRVIAQRGYERSIDRLNAAVTVEERDAALAEVQRKKRAYGAILLSEDRMARPWMYDKGRRGVRARNRPSMP